MHQQLSLHAPHAGLSRRLATPARHAATPWPVPCSAAQCPTHQPAAASSSSWSHQQQQQQRQRQSTVVPRAGFGGFGAGAGTGKRNADCPCGSGKLYKECCQPFHKSAVLAPSTPEALVRARYSAFSKKDHKFLRATSHPDNPALQGSSTTLPDGTTRQCSYEEDLAVTFLSVDFTGLTLLSSSVEPDGQSASVDVEARFKRVVDETGKRVSKPQEQVWRERAQLVRGDEGRWLVRDVTALSTNDAAAPALS